MQMSAFISDLANKLICCLALFYNYEPEIFLIPLIYK